MSNRPGIRLTSLRAAVKGGFASFAFAGVSALAAAPAPTTNVIYASAKSGSDGNDCQSVARPCLTLQGALGKVNDGGEIVILDAGGYGPGNVTKSVSIVNDGVGAANVQQPISGGTALTINTPGAVTLRGLTLDGGGVAGTGVSIVNAASLTVVNCVARRFRGSGFMLRPTGALRLAIMDSAALDNVNGVYAAPNGGSISGVLANVVASGNATGYGLLANGRVALTVVGGVYSRNASGVAASGGAALTARDVVANNNANTGIASANTGSVARLAHSLVSGNSLGMLGGATYGDNNLRGNSTSVSGAVKIAPQ